MYKDSACDAAASGGPGGIFNSNVIGNNYLIDLYPIVSSHIGSHLEIHYISCIILDNEEHSFTAVCSLNCLIDLVGSRRCEYRSCHSSVQHTLAYIAAVGGLVAASASGNQRHLAFGAACTHYHVQPLKTLDIVGISRHHTVKHLVDDVVNLIDQFLHDFTSFSKLC